MMRQRVEITGAGGARPAGGSAGLASQCPGEALTVSAMAMATGGVGTGNIIMIYK